MLACGPMRVIPRETSKYLQKGAAQLLVLLLTRSRSLGTPCLAASCPTNATETLGTEQPGKFRGTCR